MFAIVEGNFRTLVLNNYSYQLRYVMQMRFLFRYFSYYSEYYIVCDKGGKWVLRIL